MEWAAGGLLLIYAVMLASSLGARREPLGKIAKMAFAWVGIFIGAFVLFTFLDVNYVKQRLSSKLTGAAVVEANGEVRIPMRNDGHFWVQADVNGVPVDFLVDTGATFTTVDRRVAQRTDLAMLEGRRAQVQTANGTVSVGIGRAEALSIGPITAEDILIQVAEVEDVNVLGMNFLSKLAGWRVEGRFLILRA